MTSGTGWEAQTKGKPMTIATCPSCGRSDVYGIYVRSGGELVCRVCKEKS